MLWERETRLRESLRDLPRALRPATVSAGVVTFVMVMAGPLLLVYQAASEAGFTAAQTGSWYFAVLVAGGLLELALALAYHQPVAAGVSITATALLVQALPGFTLGEAAGAYLLDGGAIVLLAFSGGFQRLLALVPAEIVMGMLAGVLLRFGTGLFREAVAAPALVLPVVLAWLVAGRWLQRVVPPVAVALAAGVALALWRQPAGAPGLALELTLPVAVAPVFTLNAALSLALPLLLVVLTSQNAAGIAVLWAAGYRPPVNAITLATGLFTLATAAAGGHGVSLGSPRTAVAAERHTHRDPDLRYGAVVADAVLMIGAGFCATALVGLFALLPAGLVRVVAGLAMLPVILRALERAFGQGRRPMGSLLALVIAASGEPLFGVSAVFWALVLAPPLSLLLERPPPPVD